MGKLILTIFILTKKNLKLLFTKYQNIVLFILLPLLVKLTIVYFDYSINLAKKSSFLPNPLEHEIHKIPKCGNPSDCVSLGYFIVGKEEDWIHDIMKTVSKKNQLEFNKDVKNLLNTNDQKDILEYTNNYRNKTQIAVIWCTSEWSINFDKYDLKIPCQFEKLDDKLVHYSIYYNMTLGFESPYFFKLNSTFPINQYVISTKRALDEAIIIEETKNPSFEYKISSKSFPVIENIFYKNTDFISTSGCFLFYISIGFSFLLIMSDLIEEKVKGIKLFLTVSGLSSCSYLLIWSIYNFVLSFIFSCLNCIVILWVKDGLMKNVPLVFWFVYFFVSIYTMNVFAILINSIANKGPSGYLYAYGFLLFSFVFQALLNNPNSLNIFYSGKKLATLFRVLFEFYPGYNFIKIYSDLVYFSGSYFKLDLKMFVSGEELKFKDIFKSFNKITMTGDTVFPSIFNSFLLLLRNMFLFYLLSYIFEQTLKSNQGISFDLRSFFCWHKRRNHPEILLKNRHYSVVKEEESVNLSLEMDKNSQQFKDSIIVDGISKVFYSDGFFKKPIPRLLIM